MRFPPHLLLDQPAPDGYLCKFDHEDFERACASVLWHGDWEAQTAQVMAVLSRLNILKDGDNVLDYGCGVGRVAKAVRAVYDVAITAADRSAQMRVHAERYLAGWTGITVCSDEEALRGSGTFEAVLAVEVFQHIPLELLPGIVTILTAKLAPGGLLFVYGNEHLDVGQRGLAGATPVRSVLETRCRVLHHEVVSRTAAEPEPDRHVLLCVGV